MIGITCHSGISVQLRTSWIEANASRRFLGCARYGQVNTCNFLKWYDHEISERSKQAIPGLLRSLEKSEDELGRVEDELGRLKKKVKVLLCLVLLLWLLVVKLFVGGLGNGLGNRGMNRAIKDL
ncbi:hypothetical protein ACH5RR_026486 [Cinchona calisaya]|uniref:Zinc finger GRF-type domain-containing protein n=1 Tax=Cinchona calisaya TaxID=153742 RepID=A0ABD2Z3U4_9GENT